MSDGGCPECEACRRDSSTYGCGQLCPRCGQSWAWGQRRPALSPPLTLLPTPAGEEHDAFLQTGDPEVTSLGSRWDALRPPEARRFRELRVRLGVRLRQAAGLLGLSMLELGKLEAGFRTLSAADWQRALGRLGTEPMPGTVPALGPPRGTLAFEVTEEDRLRATVVRLRDENASLRDTMGRWMRCELVRTMDGYDDSPANRSVCGAPATHETSVGLRCERCASGQQGARRFR